MHLHPVVTAARAHAATILLASWRSSRAVGDDAPQRPDLKIVDAQC
jgi:hypothetical protein